MMSHAKAEIFYRPRGRAESIVVGAHRGRRTGGQGSFLDHVPYLQQPDPRHIDLRLTLRDPFETIYVRRYEQRLAITLFAIVDISRSMDFEGTSRKLALVGQLCACLARSARRQGDTFGLIGCDTKAREDLFFPAMRRSGLELEIERRFERLLPMQNSADGLIDAAAYLTGKRKLVFLVSDFRIPLLKIETVLQSLARHDVVPVVVSDSAEETALPPFGFIEIRDLETNQHRMVFMRPALRRRWLAQAAARRLALGRLFRRYGRPPFELLDTFDADRLSRHLLET
jgi:uncharacterized protein (DUF58 family)